MFNDPRFNNCGFILSSIKSEYELLLRDLRDKYKYLIWLEDEAKYELENYNDSVMEERVENVLEWIEEVKPTLIRQIKEEKPILIKTLKIEDTNSSNLQEDVSIKRFLTEIEELNSIPRGQWSGICKWEYYETVKFVEDTFKSVHKQISIYNQIISISKQGDEKYKKAAFETDEMIKKKELRRLLKLKIKELKLKLKFPERNNLSKVKPQKTNKIVFDPLLSESKNETILAKEYVKIIKQKEDLPQNKDFCEKYGISESAFVKMFYTETFAKKVIDGLEKLVTNKTTNLKTKNVANASIIKIQERYKKYWKNNERNTKIKDDNTHRPYSENYDGRYDPTEELDSEIDKTLNRKT